VLQLEISSNMRWTLSLLIHRKFGTPANTPSAAATTSFRTLLYFGFFAVSVWSGFQLPTTRVRNHGRFGLKGVTFNLCVGLLDCLYGDSG
jgi:hypothetical protein